MNGVTYDAGALIAADRGSPSIWVLHRQILDRGVEPVVPAGVLGQVWRGGPQARLARFLAGCRIEDLTEARARSAGAACARAGTADVIDASVVVGALLRDEVVVSSDPDDLKRLATALGAKVTVEAP